MRQLGDALRYVVHADSLRALGVLAVGSSLLQWLGKLPAPGSSGAHVVARLVTTTYFYLVARKASQGSRRLPTPADYRDTWDALIQPLGQALAATAWCWVPLIWISELSVGVVVFVERFEADPVALLRHLGAPGYMLLAFSVFYLPAALAGTFFDRGILPSLDPTIGFRLLRPVARHYTKIFALLAALSLAAAGLDVASLLLEQALPLPLAGPVLSFLLRLWVPLAQARLLGGFVFVHLGRPGRALGQGLVTK